MLAVVCIILWAQLFSPPVNPTAPSQELLFTANRGFSGLNSVGWKLGLS